MCLITFLASDPNNGYLLFATSPTSPRDVGTAPRTQAEAPGCTHLQVTHPPLTLGPLLRVFLGFASLSVIVRTYFGTL